MVDDDVDALELRRKGRLVLKKRKLVMRIDRRNHVVSPWVSKAWRRGEKQYAQSLQGAEPMIIQFLNCKMILYYDSLLVKRFPKGASI